MQSPATPVLDIAGLTHGYGPTPVLNDLAIRLDRGVHHLLLGPSGSGKTTLVHAISGLLAPDKGQIMVDGEAMTGRSQTARDALRRNKIGLIFQSLRLVSALTVRQNLHLAGRLSGHPTTNDAIDGLLAQLGIAHRAAAKPRRLSQGEAQRAAIARALIGRPSLLIADEPTSALDDDNAARVASLLIEAADRNGSTLLIATHDQRLRKLIPHTITLGAQGGTIQ
ncbi:MAG: ATP-binding cassette domain-containing protein [Sphingobium sp.]|uniref:ABC transporter ATP-binding protein n=1 Tax=Sphingobium xenophagum TaxID=121428 RepID=A0A249MXK3_SPHXE|nr:MULTISPECIES: ATP-binding cassette domain-containing protein [Sphingobium]MBU0658308.1 ATP-binding cassette domain-containing protein [Alphaproteobacteria bacterium]ASY45884.1 ABC transporter ATP-binding protein [Sphingobium xenophagum]MBA4754879.1 ATP-binding cassette domain-containing protein [Sphingobium sp.]MBS89632.1 ABC transporter ATP-binding protein [Sphingobium sp.]MBU0775728.1 ATP-binding cassette domain-containing protein [Alphaproteobacteria bacterium]|tara:strand:+ start:3174 stop:3845 length:672 start_codon:yes stop_codon:yes gene_type:complete